MMMWSSHRGEKEMWRRRGRCGGRTLLLRSQTGAGKNGGGRIRERGGGEEEGVGHRHECESRAVGGQFGREGGDCCEAKKKRSRREKILVRESIALIPLCQDLNWIWQDRIIKNSNLRELGRKRSKLLILNLG
jgi:hypothetical protein